MLALLLVLSVANADSPAVRAKELTGLASEDFEGGRYAQAAKEYQEADRLVPKATLLIKIAKCYEKAGDLAKAADSYRAYLRRSPFAANRAAIKKTIARLTRQMKQSEDSLALVPLSPDQTAIALVPLTPPPPAPPPTTVATQEPPPAPPPVAEATAETPHRSLAPILMTTGGGVAVALSVLAGYWGGWGLDALSTSQSNQSHASPAYKAVYNSEISTYKTQAGAWLSVSAVLAAGGIYLLVAGPTWGSGSAAASSSVSLAPTAGGAAAVWTGTFQ